MFRKITGVQHQTECAELVSLAFPVGLAYLSAPAVEDEPGQGGPGFLQRQLRMNLQAVAIISIEEVQKMFGLGYSAALRQYFSEQSWCSTPWVTCRISEARTVPAVKESARRSMSGQLAVLKTLKFRPHLQLS